MNHRLADSVRRYGDAVLAVVLVGLMVVQVWTLNVSLAAQLGTTVAALALAYPLARRTEMPLLLISLLAVIGVFSEWAPRPVADLEAVGLIMLLVIYNAAAHTSGRRAVLAGALTLAFGIGGLLGDPDGAYVGGVIFFSMLFGAPWLAGRVVRRRRLRESQLEHEKAEAEAAIVEERSRIARELHDVVAHGISVIVLQARGGRRQLDVDTAQTRDALDAIEVTATQALDEMRRLLGLLRESDDELALAPQPSLARVEALVDQVRAAGLPVELSIKGEPAALPPGVDLSAYRIVQEALTNALKHAGPATARVLVTYGADGLDLEISDSGSGATNGAGSGHGLTGIRERVAIFGGDVDAGSKPDGGYVVRARLPYASER